MFVKKLRTLVLLSKTCCFELMWLFVSYLNENTFLLLEKSTVIYCTWCAPRVQWGQPDCMLGLQLSLSHTLSESLASSGHQARSMHWWAGTWSHWSFSFIYWLHTNEKHWREEDKNEMEKKGTRKNTFQNVVNCRFVLKNDKKVNILKIMHVTVFRDCPRKQIKMNKSVMQCVFASHTVYTLYI